MCPSGFKLGPDWKTCLDVDECETSEAIREGECGGREYCRNTEGERGETAISSFKENLYIKK